MEVEGDIEWPQYSRIYIAVQLSTWELLLPQ